MLIQVKKTYLILFVVSLPVYCFEAVAQTDSREAEKLQLWFNHPAFDWNQALPVGNGSFGAMVFGGIETERLQLNEETVWAGEPADFVNPEAKKALPEVRRLLFAGRYAEAQELANDKMMGDKTVHGTYQTLGDLTLTFDTLTENISNYKRTLDLENAIAHVSYHSGQVLVRREVFSSAPGKVLVVKLAVNEPGALSFGVKLSRPGNNAGIELEGNEIVMKEHIGNGVGVKMVTRVKVQHHGGTLEAVGQELKIKKSDSVTIRLTAATDYWGEDPAAVSQTEMAEVEGVSYESLKKAHIEDYQQYFNRVDFHIGTSDAVNYPTDTRVSAMQQGVIDPQLIQLYYQFGRYLLISSSRPGGLPANLQGIWADGLYPPWSADYHININIQMNYWPAEVTNLSEMHMPFLQFLDRLRADARKTAKDMYGIDKGTVAHFTTDAWHFTEPYGEPRWAMWPMGMAWCAQHSWEHYLFTEDKNYLRELGYPVMKEAAEFCANFLVEHPETKYLVSGPSISPENTFKTEDGEVATMVMGPTMDHMIMRDLMASTIEASRILKKDAAFRRRLEKILGQLAPIQISKDGRIMEWTEEFEENEPGHRHISHLFALHPGRQITQQKNPELLEAARKTIEYRLSHGGGHTGWSRAWIINFFARLKDGEAAYENLLALLRKSTLPNLFDTHPPFQIDGNFGATAGISEMLLQSHAGEIELLPALPNAWRKGHIHGLVARGGFEVDINWDQGKLKALTINSNLGNKCQVRYGSKVISLDTEKGKSYSFDAELKQN